MLREPLPLFHSEFVPETDTALLLLNEGLLPLANPILADVVQNCPPLVTSTELLNVLPEPGMVPIRSAPALLRMPLSIFNALLVPFVPTMMPPPSMFHVALDSTVTVLLFALLPMVRPLLER